jgi:hypothetical protein
MNLPRTSPPMSNTDLTPRRTMRRTKFWHALNCLAHPVSILALLLAAVNDQVLQIYWPSWWTGKLGDAAWMVFLPFLAAAVLVWFVPIRPPYRSGWVFPLALCLVCAGFIAVKSVPGVNSALLDLAMSLGWSLKLRLDPTDLVVLPAGLIAWRIWNAKFVRTPGQPGLLAVLVLSLFVMLADMMPPPSNCLFFAEDGSLVAISLHSNYRSRDGGVTWVPVPEADQDERDSCSYMAWPVTLETDPPITFHHDRSEGLYQTTDGGKTLTRVHVRPDEKTLVDFAVATPFDTLVIAMGNGDFATRLPDGEWLRFEDKYPELQLEQVRD